MQCSADSSKFSTDLPLTDHAQMRMGQRGLSERVVAMALR